MTRIFCHGGSMDQRLPASSGIAPLLAALLLWGCGEAPPSEEEGWRDDVAAATITEAEAMDRAVADHAGMTYDDLGSPYGCTDDCSGHEAGVAWAQENEIHDPSDCGGRSASFVEGCEAYAEAVQNSAAEIEQRGY